jgi:hypothetical protein
MGMEKWNADYADWADLLGWEMGRGNGTQITRIERIF